MVSVKAVYIGNGIESFVENNFSTGINVIYSLDNNRGKTILMQGIMFCLGAIPTFPDGFPFREYTYIVDLECAGKPITVARKQNSFAVKTVDGIQALESVEAFKGFWNNNISELPEIVKDGRAVVAGLELYTQMFFVGQDGLSSAKVNSGYFNKKDFIEMLYSFNGLSARTLESGQVEKLKRRKEELIGHIKTLSKKADALKQRGTALSVMSATTDSRDMREFTEELDRASAVVSDLRKLRNRLAARRTKNKIVLDELRSLKINVKVGSLTCLQCGSENVGYRMADSGVVFDVTTSEMRTQIINSLEDRISGIEDDLQSVTRQLRSAQEVLDDLLEAKPEVTLADIMACKDDFLNVRDIDTQIRQNQDEMDRIDEMLSNDQDVSRELRSQREEFRKELLSSMNYARKFISGNPSEADYKELFTTQANVLSGSDGTIYFSARLYAIAKVLNHGMPLLVDSFRADDLSSGREEKLLDLFSSLSNQMILTTTIKREEGSSKYVEDNRIQAIDYSDHTINKLLSSQFNKEFAAKADELGIFLGKTLAD